MNAPPTPRPWRAREREWAWLAGAFSLACIVFSAWPGLDLWAAALFRQADGGFVGNGLSWVRAVYVAVPWFGRAAGLAGLVIALIWWKRPPALLGVRWWRRSMLLALAMWLGTGALVNGALKEGWGRARPVAVQEFGGPAHFTPALRPAKQCRTNCSFVSGHSATGFTLLAVGLLGAPATRRRWLLIGAAAGLLVGGGRMAQGGHFLSDVLFSGLVLWLASAAIREAWLRIKARQRRRSVH
ncbi:Phosphoesterase [Rubrivivax sp. A210]|uniref:phosphatase PAP2 family protein n=1 Tax=Rubrivivax sp. A210 TaxID=2772301 RepID=UPI001919F39D|nr:phosphatase PAP2 family protein [Rubrivivax sp. A210]CAD5370607.1 Phosphoesterase [Rubrivivax sp. A210]